MNYQDVYEEERRKVLEALAEELMRLYYIFDAIYTLQVDTKDNEYSLRYALHLTSTRRIESLIGCFSKMWIDCKSPTYYSVKDGIGMYHTEHFNRHMNASVKEFIVTVDKRENLLWLSFDDKGDAINVFDLKIEDKYIKEIEVLISRVEKGG